MHSPLPRLPVILLQVHDKAAQHLKNELHVLFNNADETLFEMADKAQSDAEQSLYFEAMRDVRLKRKNIERGFLERLFFAFIKLTQPDISESAVRRPVLTQNASPLMFNEWERDQVINAMVAQVLTRDQLALCQLTSRLNTLCWVTLNEHTNPLGPAMLCEYFLEAERDQGIDLKVKLIMLQLFEKYLLSQTPRLYADANQLLVATGILPELSAATSCCSSNKAPRGKKSEVAGEDVGHLVGKLFDYISSDRHLASPLKKLMSQLQEPMLKIALLDQQFFSNDSHPARCLLNVMADAAMGWDDTGDVRNDPLYKEIERVVKQLEHCSCVGTPESLESVLQDFVRFAHAERGVVERLEQRIRTHELLQVKTSGSVLSGLPSALDEQDRLGLLLVSQLRIGTWIELQATSTRRQRCKLIAILEPEGLHVFVNRHGLKVVEKSRCDLIVQLRNGTISLLDDRLLFDRALASMIANLGQYSAH